MVPQSRTSLRVDKKDRMVMSCQPSTELWSEHTIASLVKLLKHCHRTVFEWYPSTNSIHDVLRLEVREEFLRRERIRIRLAHIVGVEGYWGFHLDRNFNIGEAAVMGRMGSATSVRAGSHFLLYASRSEVACELLMRAR
jgi:hypothetical protein